MTRRRAGTAAALTGALLAGVVLAVALGAVTRAPAAQPAPATSTALVVRTDLATTVLTGATLGFAPGRPVINRLPGTYTWLPAPAMVIRPGQVLYRVDDLPVVLMAGRVPDWRPFGLGMTSGPDVYELQRGLISGGFAAGLLTAPTGIFDQLTADAVQRWQAAFGFPVTGQLGAGQVLFLPEAVRVGAVTAQPGQQAVPGQLPYQVTTGRRIVTIPLSPDLPAVRPGQAVSIVLPSGLPVPGRVASVGPAAGQPAGQPAGGASPSQAGQPAAAGQGAAASEAIVLPVRPAGTGTAAGVPVQVALPVRAVRDVLAVPVTALLALAGGGYGLEVVTRSGAHHLVGVQAGLFAAGRVQVSGPGIAAGLRVVTAQ